MVRRQYYGKEFSYSFVIDVDAVQAGVGSLYGGEDSPDDISRRVYVAGEVGSLRL